jgi:FkbM family methyltransferase
MTFIPPNRASGLRERGLFRPDVTRLQRPFQAIGSKYRYLMGHPGFRRSPTLTLVRLLRWRLQCTLRIPATLSFPEWDARFYLPPRWHGAGTTMIYALRSSYEKELKHLSRLISPGMVVVDGGANCGIYTVAAAKLVGPSGLVLSFEPGAEAFSNLHKNVGLNRLKNVRIYRAALSEKEGKAVLYHHKGGPNSFSLGSSGASETDFEEVAARTLCNAMQEHAIQRIGLIKLDVEGAEELALLGAKPIVACSRPTVIFEVHAVAAKRLGLRPSGAWELLEGLGYSFFSLTDSGDLCPLNRPPAGGDVINVVAIHGRQNP